MERSAEKGISPVVATILLIGLTIVGVSALAAFLGTFSLPSPPAALRIQLENLIDGASGFVVAHIGGNPIPSAFDGLRWINMKVLINGEPVTLENAEYNGSPIPNVTDFKFADRLRLQARLSSGDEIRVIYAPTYETLQLAVVR